MFLLACELRAPFDRELLLCAAWLHDAGLYSASDVAYVSEGRRLIEPLLREHGWPSERIRRAGDAVEHHHELVPQWHRGVEVELLRRADLVDVSRGLVRFGIPRAAIGTVVERAPRDGFVTEVLRRLLARERLSTLWRIFRP